ncbi:hypothetical protein UY3_04927 [Chelonia mydas]|uniref:C2H2-type domain-containing protein n=1 Tax=Chelonia mydas TaxID=8469 RepID=M7CB23_CHEMY|nr:hypothetical protein UY3_04927 [Chelonia mydas]
MEHQALSEEVVSLTDLSNGELDPEDPSEDQSKGHARKNHAALGASKIDHNVPRHRCALCNREFLGGHIVRHAQAHQKKGSFSCVICCRKFRQRGIMLKHLRNHVKKIQRQHLAATHNDDQETPALSEVNCSHASVSFENGNSNCSKDNEPEAAVVPSTDTEVQNHDQELDVAENHVSKQDNVTENGSCDNCLNNTPEPLTTESLPEGGDSPSQESPILHKVNGALCSQKDLDVMDQEGNFKCPANSCIRVFKKIRFLNKHARKAHPTDLKVQQHIMKWNKGKCRFCQRKFADSQHFIDHLKRHVYPNVYFCLHFNCNQRFKLSTELAEHTKSHSVFKAQCNFAECCELFEELPLLYEHEAQHYLNKTECSEVNEKNSSDTLSESLCGFQEKDASSSEKEAVDLPVPTWKARKDSTEPKTYIQSIEKKAYNVIQNGSENSSDVTATVLSLIDQKMPIVQPNSENCNVRDQLVNGHMELEQTCSASSDAALDRVADETRTENGSIPVLQNCNDIPQNNTAAVSQSPSKPNQTTENTSYGLIVTKPYVRPLPPSYLDERYISMPKRRKTVTDKIDAHSEQDKACSKSAERFRCGNCLTIYCNSEALEAHLAQKKCQTLFGFDSDDEKAIHAILVYSQSVEELLKRRKVYREIIFKYLAKEGVVVPPCSEKHQLIHHAKQYWSGQLTDRVAETEDINPNKQSYEQRQKQQEENDWHRLGREFCQWFFELLNSQHPLGRQSKEQWGPQHFWEDVKLKFCYNTLEKNMEEYVGAELVSLRLLSLVKEEYLLLNPNLGAGGLKCVISPHGLVVVAVAGTVHRGNICLGIFEQIFGLIRCPVRENTWKIKLVNLKIVGENALEPGTQVQKPSIKYESNELRELYDGKELSLLESQILSNVRTELGE